MEYLHTNQYFTCTSGLAPAKMSSTQNVVRYDEKKYPLLTKQSTATSQIGDFFCRWTVVLAAAVVALGALTGGAALLVLGAGLLASGLMCGALFAPARKWVNEKGNHKIGQIETLTARAQMTCPIGGVITVAPGINSPWKAMLYTARNTGWALLEGYFVGKTLAGGGGALMANGAAGAGKYFLGNMLFMQGAARTIGAVDQVGFEGMLRDGQSFGDAVKDHAVQGATMFEQPFINIYKKATGQVKDPQGNDVPLNWQDFYGAALSIMGTKEMTKAAMMDVNMPKETMTALSNFGKKIAAGFKGKAFELMRTGAKLGKEASPDTIRTGEVKMEQHPNFQTLLDELKQMGYEFRYNDKGNAHAAFIAIFDKDGNLIRTEKYVTLEQGSRFIDLEHEVGHVKQLEGNLQGKVPTESYLQRENGTLKKMNSNQLTTKQNIITEYENRLAEIQRLKDRGAGPELIKEHEDGIIPWQKDYNQIMKYGGKDAQWAKDNFPNIGK